MIKLTVVTYLMVSKHHPLDRYDNSGILTSLDIFRRELKNENHKGSFLKRRNHTGNWCVLVRPGKCGLRSGDEKQNQADISD